MDKTIGYIHYTDTDTQSVMNDNVDYGGLNLGEILSGNIAFAARLAIGYYDILKIDLAFQTSQASNSICAMEVGM